MSKHPQIHLTRRESQIMDIVHRRQRATVEEIRSELPDASAPSGVRKLLEIMIERGLLNREYRRPTVRVFSAGEARGSQPIGRPASAPHILQRFTELRDGCVDRFDGRAVVGL